MIAWALVGVASLSLGSPAAQTVSSAANDSQSSLSTQMAQAAPSSYPYQQQVYAPQTSSPWESYKLRLAVLARQRGVSDATINAVLPGLQLNQRVMQLDQAQTPTAVRPDYVPSFGPYLDRHITTSLIDRGYARYSQHWANLSRIQSLYGVDPSVIIAIYGKETSYGSVTGNFDLLEALASLGYEGRRRSMFEDEFIATLKLMDQGVARWLLRGSYAGATGYPQFMPSVVLRLRQDGDGDGYSDIWRSEDDAFASIANYLRDAGWRPNIPWGVPAYVPPSLNRAAIRSRVNPPRCAAVYRRHSRWLTVKEWRALGVVPTGSQSLPDNEMVTLMETPGAYAPGYLLTSNYRAILDYNCSNYYAMTIGLLANAIARR
jgi:lytic murein transglycosylase